MVEEKTIICTGRTRRTLHLADKAAIEIRRMIIENRFDSGEPLSEVRLAEMMGMSRTPIREAITILEQEGLLRIIGGKGAFVTELDKKTFQEVNDLRMVLEPLAAVSAMYTISPAVISEHKKIWTHFLECVVPGNGLSATELSEKDDLLHFTYIDNCDNTRLRNFLRVLRVQTNRYVYAYWNMKEYDEDTIRQHLDIIQALEARNADLLRKAIELHIDYNNRFIGIYNAS